jgi:hypothetical protein
MTKWSSPPPFPDVMQLRNQKANSPRTITLLGAVLLFSFSLDTSLVIAADEADTIPFPADSPEHAALTAASSYLDEDDFMLREDYWKGSVTPQTGKAVRLQFFKGNTYRFFFAIEPEKANAATTLSMRIYDAQSREVAVTQSKPSEIATALNFKPDSTGLYLILMGVDIAKGSNPYRDYPAVMFYGFE